MEIKTSTRYIHIAPRKLRVLRAAIQRMHPLAATKRLALMQDRAAKFFRKSILSALDVAKQRQIAVEGLSFKELRVDEGPDFKRFRAGSKGSAKKYVRGTSHITVLLTVSPVKNNRPKKSVEQTTMLIANKNETAVSQKTEVKKKTSKVIAAKA